MFDRDKFLMTIMLFLCLQTNAQLSKQTLDNIYNDNLTHKLDSFFNERYLETKTEYNKSLNDTIKLVSQLINKLEDNDKRNQNDKYYRYIFLQENCKVIKIDTVTLPFDGPLFFDANSKNLKPIKYDNQTINAIWAFIRPSGYESLLISEYNLHKDKLKKSEIKKAEAINEMLDKKLKFIEKFLSLPYTWGHFANRLVPCTINSVVFNNAMTEVQISYDFTWTGGEVTYKLVNEKWTKSDYRLRWID